MGTVETASLQLPKDLIENAIQQHVSLAIATALGEKSSILDEVVKRILTQKVDRDGKASNSGYRDELEFVQWAVNNALKKAIQETLENELSKYKETIKKHLIEQLSKKNSPVLKQLVDVMSNGIIDASTSKWRLNITFEGQQ